MKKLLLTLFVTIIIGTAAKAQFDNKITAQFSLGVSTVTGPDGLTDYFDSGMSFDGGLQYNFNRNFSLVGLVKYATLWSAEYYDDYIIVAGLDNLGISLAPKYRFRAGKKLQPYVLGGVSLNYITYSIAVTDLDLSYSAIFPAALGYIGAAGLEYGVSNNISLFTQVGTNGVLFDDGAQGYDNLSTVFIQFGLNLNLFKSKSL